MGEEETVNASWISIVLLSFEVLLHLRVITGLLNFAMHSTSVAEVTGSFFILTRMGEIQQQKRKAIHPELRENHCNLNTEKSQHSVFLTESFNLHYFYDT